MLQYKTIADPNPVITGKYAKSLTPSQAQESISAVDAIIQNEALGGWVFQSMTCVTKRIVRKKKIAERIFGWIPLLGKWLFPHMVEECGYGREVAINVLVFVKEV